MISKTPTEIDFSGSVFFLGSGFSRNAKNIRNKNLPTGPGLKDEFSRLLGVDSNAYDLKTLADEVASRQDLNLYQILYELFTVKELQKHQTEILCFPWQRIYTTNFDDAVELAYRQNNNNAPSFSYDDAKPKRLLNGSVIHLHGIIRKTTEDNVMHQLVLNENSYVRQHFEKSLWYDDFIRDLRFCHACFFIGYSLNDYHISALLLQDPTVREKTYFVTCEKVDPIFANRVVSYGTILPIGAEQFAEFCRALPSPKPVSDPYALKAFRYLDPHMDKKTLSPPTAIEVLNLVTYGTFNYQRCLSTLPGGEYVVPRNRLAEEAVTQLKNSRCLLVHSRLGNGKTIFLYILAHKLSEQGYSCFWCRNNPLKLQQDLELLQTFKKTAIFFDSYNTAIDLIEQFTSLPSDTKFIVAVRTGVQEVRLHEIQQKLPQPLQRVNLNIIQKEDINDFKKLLDRSGIRVPDLEQVMDQCQDIREIVVSLYDHREIKEKIRTELQPLLQDQNFKSVFIVSHLLIWLGQDVDTAFLRTVTHRDPYAEMARFREIAGDVLKLDDDNVQVISAMFSEYLIQSHFTTSDMIECVHLIIIEAAKRKAERRYKAVLSSVMRFSNLRRALCKDPHYLSSLINLFDKLHRDIDVNREPLFWLQYSILMTAADDLTAAEDFLETAYARAAESHGFRTFQIDTFALRLLLLIEQNVQDAKSAVTRFGQITGKIELVLSMINDESHRTHAVQVLEGIEPFISARVSGLSTDDKNVLLFQFTRLIESLDHLSPEIQGQTGSEQLKQSILRAKKIILSYSSTHN